MLSGLGAARRGFSALGEGNVSRWSAAAGIELAEVRYFAGFGERPDQVAVWALETEEGVASLLETLKERDFAPFWPVVL